MQIDHVAIDDTFAEAFRMRYARVIVTAADDYWLEAALRELTGYGSSVIACDAELGVERRLNPEHSPDRRPAAAVLAFGFSADGLAKALANRIGQCVMTCASTAVYDGLPEAAADGTHGATLEGIERDGRIPLGKQLRFFGDGYQKSKLLDGRRFWRVPVMDGEFVVEQSLGVAKGIGGGNIILQAAAMPAALELRSQLGEQVDWVAGLLPGPLDDVDRADARRELQPPRRPVGQDPPAAHGTSGAPRLERGAP